MNESSKRPSGGQEVIKVCLITSVFPRAEGDRPGCFLLEAAQHTKQLGGIEVHAFAPSFEGLGNHRVGGVSVHRFRYFFKRWENLTHTSRPGHERAKNPLYLLIACFYLLFGSLAMVRLCWRERFDILHVHWPFPHAIFALAGKILGRPAIVYTFYGAELNLTQRSRWIHWLLSRLLPLADAVTCISTFTGQLLQRVRPTLFELIPFGAVIEEKAVEPTQNTQKQILFVGRLVERKGVRYLIEALPEVRRKHDACLSIAGAGSSEQVQQLQRLVDQLELGPYVNFLGFVTNEDLETLYQGCDVFVLPSTEDNHMETEGLGLVLIEALCFRKPVVASKVGGIVDIVKDGQTGLLVEQKSGAQLAHAITRCFDDPEFANRLAEQGYQHVQEAFSWESIGKRLQGLYRGLARPSASPPH